MDIAESLNRETVRHVEVSPPLCVEEDAALGEVLQTLRRERRGSVLVCRDERPIGIFTERDALCLLASGADLAGPISEVMTPNPLATSADESIAAAIAKMATGGYRRLPVLDSQGRAVGLLDVAAIVHWLVEHFPGAVYNLPPASKPASRQREGP
jgi:CBS domain-containing protein